MVATFDADDYTMNIVSIPRDTMVNVKWDNKKINSCYGMASYYGMDKIDCVMESLGDILGYDVDHYVIVDLNAFDKLITVLSDEMGGIWFDVPQKMDYDDPYQDLHIHVEKGYQLVDAKTAIGIVRFRGYGDADIGRIGVQQDFLLAVAKQTLQNYEKLSITTLASLILNYVKTDLTNENLVWLAQRFFRMDYQNISFHTMPGDYSYTIRVDGYKQSFIPIDVDNWLAMVNEYLNPFDDDVSYRNLDILTVDPDTGLVYATSGNYEGDPDWGNR
jgi:LCP family protein required for cell wall assembly